MLSTITIISVFTEIFATGILLAGAYAFFSMYLASRKGKDIILGAFFLFFASFVALTVVSQMMYNLMGSTAEVEIVQKFIYFDITACAFLLWLFIADKFAWHGRASAKIASIMLFVASMGILYIIFASRMDLVYRKDVIEPLVNFHRGDLLQLVPSKEIWAFLWGLLCAVSFIKGVSAPAARRNLLFLTSFSSLLLLAAYILTSFYISTTEATFLIMSWFMMLFGSIGLLIGEVIPEGSRLALEPMGLFRSRILYKLILIFVFLIVMTLEVTTLATLNISRNSLIAAIMDNQKLIAQSIASEIEYGKLDALDPKAVALIEKIVLAASTVSKDVYVVDNNGDIIAHPQETYIDTNVRSWVFVEGSQPFDDAMRYGSGSFVYTDNNLVENACSYAKVKGAALRVFVKEPKWEAYSEIRKVETFSLLFSIVGIVLTILVGIFFARSIEKPIRDVIAGTEAVRKGNLNHRIQIGSSDEIGDLAAAFNQMTADLKETQEHLVASEKLAALGTMAAGMAHEIKNPLVSLRTFTQLLQQKFDDPEFRRKFSAIVPQEIERINRIAESLLKFGRPSKPELGRVNAGKILGEVLDLLENECRKNSIRITTKFAATPDITGDPMQLSQAFINIVLNAIQAMPQGGELTIKTDVGEVIRLGRFMRKGVLRHEGDRGEGVWGEEEETAEEAKDSPFEKPIPVVFIEVTDTGMGIPEENLKSLFDPFYTTKSGGTGMGLPITLRIIEDHKGSIKVRSREGKGTTFIVTLPQDIGGA